MVAGDVDASRPHKGRGVHPCKNSISDLSRGYVYVLGSKQFGWYKIGRSKSATIRVYDIGVLSPFKVELVALWMVSDPVTAELEMHRICEERRINGDWFSYYPDELYDLLEIQYPSNGERIPTGDLPKFYSSNTAEDVLRCEDKRYRKKQAEQFSKLLLDSAKALAEDRGIDYKSNKKFLFKEILEKENYCKKPKDRIAEKIPDGLVINRDSKKS